MGPGACAAVGVRRWKRLSTGGRWPNRCLLSAHHAAVCVASRSLGRQPFDPGAHRLGRGGHTETDGSLGGDDSAALIAAVFLPFQDL